MPLNLDNVAQAFRNAVDNGVPTSFKFRKKLYDAKKGQGASFNPGGYTYDPVSGGVVEGVGPATLMYAVKDFPVKRPKLDEDIQVWWHGQWIDFSIVDSTYGHAIATFTLGTPEARSNR